MNVSKQSDRHNLFQNEARQIGYLMVSRRKFTVQPHKIEDWSHRNPIKKDHDCILVMKKFQIITLEMKNSLFEQSWNFDGWKYFFIRKFSPRDFRWLAFVHISSKILVNYTRSNFNTLSWKLKLKLLERRDSMFCICNGIMLIMRSKNLSSY